MEYYILAIVFISLLLVFNQVSILKKRIKSQEDCLNKLCKLTGHENLSSYWISNELRELAMHLKQSGKEVEAVKKIRDQTQMSLVEAKQYIDKLE